MGPSLQIIHFIQLEENVDMISWNIMKELWCKQGNYATYLQK